MVILFRCQTCGYEFKHELCEPHDCRCNLCGAEYRHIQAPHKPMGVIMASVCDCEIVFADDGNGTTTVTKKPPVRP